MEKKKLSYTFADGTVSEIEVSNELYAVITEFEQAETRNNKRETRRHTSLNYLNDNGIDFAADCGNPLDALIEQENENEFWEWLSSFLNPKRIELYKKVSEGYSETEIAKHEGVSQQAISQRLQTIWKKIKLFSEKPCDLPFGVGIGRGTKTAYYILRGLRK
jgi:RNA polymerase sigma-70 factor (ECF subfamily)